MHTFEVRDQFYLDGKPFQIISGGIHYFRVVPDYWQDRLIKLKALGCNTVETYVPWNLHEEHEGTFNFDGILDLVAFIQQAASLGLYAIVRPSPYICAEWEFGGLPSWLLTKENMHLRSSEGCFLYHVRKYYEQLMPLITPLQITNGGSIILMQVENEYGYYGDDTAYLEAMRDMMRDMGVNVPLITSDGPQEDTLRGGSVAGALPTANFGSNTRERFDVLEKHVGNQPLMCTEFWVGWFDSWGCGTHHTTDVKASADDLRAILHRGSVNIYMFHGGTNFGFMNGSNYYEALTPDVTSYDYDALLTEDGQVTAKYLAFQEVIREFLPQGTVLPTLPPAIPRKAYAAVEETGVAALFDVLDRIAKPVESLHPQPMEALGQGYGYTLYRSIIQTDMKVDKFRIWDANDRAKVFVNREHFLTLYDRELLDEKEVQWHVPAGSTMDILMENMGRVNFGVRMRQQRKGIAGDVLLNGHFHTRWQQYVLPLKGETLADIPFASTGELHEGPDTPNEPSFFRFAFFVDVAADTFLDLSGWGKGCAFINGVNIGRFWEIGPQKRLYVPAPLLREGKNECIVFETEGIRNRSISFEREPYLG